MTDWHEHTFTIQEAEGLPDKHLAHIGPGTDLRVSDLMALIRDYYEENCTGGRLHCCLDDGNMEYSHVSWEVEEIAKKEGDHAAVLIGRLLLLMEERDRFLLYQRGYGRKVSDEWQFEGGGDIPAYEPPVETFSMKGLKTGAAYSMWSGHRVKVASPAWSVASSNSQHGGVFVSLFSGPEAEAREFFWKNKHAEHGDWLHLLNDKAETVSSVLRAPVDKGSS